MVVNVFSCTFFQHSWGGIVSSPLRPGSVGCRCPRPEIRNNMDFLRLRSALRIWKSSKVHYFQFIEKLSMKKKGQVYTIYNSIYTSFKQYVYPYKFTQRSLSNVTGGISSKKEFVHQIFNYEGLARCFFLDNFWRICNTVPF